MIAAYSSSALGALALVLYWRVRLQPAAPLHGWRSLLARIPLPMLALSASYGVYSFALLFVPWWVAVTQAAAFEMTYIGLAVADDLGAAQRRRATAISVGAVVASIVYNTLAGWFHRQPELLVSADAIAWLAFAILHGAPLAWVAYLVADLLLHTTKARPRPAHRAKLARAIWRLRGLARTLHIVQATEAAASAMLAQARADLETARSELAASLRTTAQQASDLAQIQQTSAQHAIEAAQQGQEITRLSADLDLLTAEAAQQAAELAQARATIERERAELAQLRAENAQIGQARAQFETAAAQLQAENAQLKHDLDLPIVVDGIDVLSIARRLRSRGISSRETADILGQKESTLRSRLAATNGHLQEAL